MARSTKIGKPTGCQPAHAYRQMDGILSFCHTYLPKSGCVGGCRHEPNPRPPPLPPQGKSSIHSTCASYVLTKVSSVMHDYRIRYHIPSKYSTPSNFSTPRPFGTKKYIIAYSNSTLFSLKTTFFDK